MAVEDKVVLLEKDCVMLVVVGAGQGHGSCGVRLVCMCYRDWRWKPVTVDEIKTFTSLMRRSCLGKVFLFSIRYTTPEKLFSSKILFSGWLSFKTSQSC